MYGMRLIDNVGWVMSGKTDGWGGNCIKCGGKLNTPFFLCKEFNEGICRDCELKNKDRTCRSLEIEHEHFNIVKME